LYSKAKEDNVVEVEFRIDATTTLKTSSHVRLTIASLPSSVLTGTNYSMDALVVFSETGRARFKCLQPLPPYFADCSWVLEDCGPFVNAKSMMDAVKDLDTLLENCCGVASIILGIPSPPLVLPVSG
jgi:regulator of nonsense transcripts 1